MERFVGTIAVVTGSSYGIGRAIVKELVKKGLLVVGLARNVKSQQELADEIKAKKTEYVGKFHHFKCDISKEQEIRDAFAKIRSEIGDRIGVLINNAGVIEDEPDLMDVDIHEFDRIFLTNAKGMLLCAKEAIQSMTANNISGHIININSVAGLPEYDFKPLQLYSASKYAARMFSHALRRELAQKKSPIKISNISPGAVDTDMYRNFETLNENFRRGEWKVLEAEDITRACIQVLDTPAHVQISEMTIIPLIQ